MIMYLFLYFYWRDEGMYNLKWNILDKNDKVRREIGKLLY